MTQLSLLDLNPPAVTTSPTSCAAARAIKPAARTIGAAVLRFLVARGLQGATDEEVQLALGIRVQTQTPRRGELCKAGLVRDSGLRRPTTSGRMATVWVVKVGST